MIIFDGAAQAAKKEVLLKKQVSERIGLGRQPAIAAVLFREDTGSQLYTRLKSEAAQRVGIEYRVHEFSLTDSLDLITETISRLNTDASSTGIIVQKPWRKIWLASHPGGDYATWWRTLMLSVDPGKDVDGLHPQTLEAVMTGDWEKRGHVLPATCRAVLFALDTAKSELKTEQLGKTIIIGRSDLLGIPLQYVLHHAGVDVELIGVKELEQRRESGQLLLDARVVVSATGQKHLVTGEMVSKGVVLIDVGEPQPDIERLSVEYMASFLTPVPGGIGPLTVSFLLENAIILSDK